MIATHTAASAPPSSLLLCFATALVTAIAAAQQPDATDTLVKTAAERLTANGCKVPATIRVEQRTSAQVIADLDEQQDLFLPADAYPVLHALRSGLGLRSGRDAAALRQQAVAGSARGLSAYYDPRRKSFVLLSTATRDAVEALAGSLLPLITHELVHAHQDAREGGLAGFFGGELRTIDSAQARRCVVEGEAELVSIRALNGPDALRQLATLRTASVLDKLFAGEFTGMIYDAGRRLAWRRHEEGGDEALLALWLAPPPSTEQVLHLGKLGQDTPTAVTISAVEGLERRSATTVGELVTYDLLRQLGLDEKGAGLAAAGWDGDQVVVLQASDDAPVAVVWRTVWDRDADAEDFAKTLTAKGTGTVVRDGRVVDWIAADEVAVRERIAAACGKARPQPARDERDEASTAAAEAEFLAALPQDVADGGFWQHESVGLAIPIAEGWEVRDVNGMKILLESKSTAQGFAVNWNVQVLPKGPIEDHQQLLDLNSTQIAAMKGLEVDAFDLGKFGEQEVVLGEYHGRFGQGPTLHFLVLLYLRGDQQVVVTATAPEKQWKEYEATLRKMLHDVRITPP